MFAAFRPFAGFVRSVGRKLDAWGVALQESHAYVEKLVPSTRVVRIRGKELQHGKQNFVASSGSLVGDVSMGEMSSVWYGAVVRGDVGIVKIGQNSTIQDCAVVAADKQTSTVIGDDVVIASGAHVTSSTVESGAMIGMGARVGAGCKIGSDSFVDAGSVVAPGTTVPRGQLWTGSPARYLRDLTHDELAFLRGQVGIVGELSQQHFSQTQKTVVELQEQEDQREYRQENYMDADAPIPEPDPDVQRYYKLTADPADEGLFRARELHDVEWQRKRLAAEAAADAEEEEYFTALASSDRAGSCLHSMTRTHPADIPARQKLLLDLRATDAKAARFVEDIVGQSKDVLKASDRGMALAALSSQLGKVLPQVLAGDVASILVDQAAKETELLSAQ